MALHIRLMQPGDFAFTDRLRALVGWNQTTADWQRFLQCAPDGCFIAEWDASAAGTGIITTYGLDLGWIGMLLVHPEYRRHGIGSALLQRCLDTLAERSIRCVKLDATPQGLPLYERFGFNVETHLSRWEINSPPLCTDCTELVPWTAAKLEQIIGLDRRALGTCRKSLLNHLAGTSLRAVIHSSAPGFGMIRPGARASYLGPVVAEAPEVAEQLIRHLLGSVAGRPVFWDLFEANGPARALAERLAFTPQRPLVRMVHGHGTVISNPQLQFAIADPATG